MFPNLIMSTTYAPHSHGVTLIEMLVTLAIASILIAIAAPSFRKINQKWMTHSTSQAMHSTLIIARSESIKNNGSIGIQKNQNTEKCRNASNNKEWGCGWFIYMDSNNNRAWDNNEPKLHEIQLQGEINAINNGGGSHLSLNRFGMINGLNARSFTFSPASDGIDSDATITLCTSSGGRVRITHAAQC